MLLRDAEFTSRADRRRAERVGPSLHEHSWSLKRRLRCRNTRIVTLRNPLARAARNRLEVWLSGLGVVRRRLTRVLSELGVNYHGSRIVAVVELVRGRHAGRIVPHRILSPGAEPDPVSDGTVTALRDPRTAGFTAASTPAWHACT